MHIKIIVENVRRIHRADLELAHGSRTVLVGRNNSGKTTLLDMVARALWSLPAPFSFENWREFHSSWYRREGTAYLRPKMTVSIPAAMLPECAVQADASFVFEEYGDILEHTVNPSSGGNTRLLTVKCDLSTLEQGACPIVAAIGNVTTQQASQIGMQVIEMVANEASWRVLDATSMPVANQGRNSQQLYTIASKWHRAIHSLIHRVLYISASRTPNFAADERYKALTQGEMYNMTSLLLHLHTMNNRAFDGLSGSLSLLFPDVRRLYLDQTGSALIAAIEFSDGRREHVTNLGFGFQNALHLLTVVTMAPTDGIIIIDEPEKGLNQACQRDFAILLEALRPDLTILVATQAEAFCRGFSATSSVILVEAEGNTSQAYPLHLSERPDDLRRLAAAMGLDPIYLGEGGKIIYVEGISDQIVLERWIALMFPHVTGFQVVALGGCGKIGEEFVKPMLIAFRSRVFVLLDSDRNSNQERMGPNIRRLVGWLDAHDVHNYYVLGQRELENYLGADQIAAVAEMHPAALRAVPGHEAWHDIKAAFEKHKGYPYDERRLSSGAFDAMNADEKRNLFLDESEAIKEKLRVFLGVGPQPA